jgi:hypothetical protein
MANRFAQAITVVVSSLFLSSVSDISPIVVSLMG